MEKFMINPSTDYLGQMRKANEAKTAYMDKEEANLDKQRFVSNLGWLMSQTRDGVLRAELEDNDTVVITYFGGGTHRVNIAMDSYAAIIRDVADRMQ